MKFIGFTNLCNPAHFYLVVSTMAITVMFIQNFYVMQNRYGGPDHNLYCIGSYSCDVPNVWLLFLIKILYVLLWTWLLNLICYAGAPMLSWFLVLLPIVVFFIVISSMFFAP